MRETSPNAPPQSAPTGALPDHSLIADGTAIQTAVTDGLFQGAYTKEGQDLTLTFQGTELLKIEGYFTFASPADLIAANGAVLTGADVVRMAGAATDGRLAALKTGPGLATGATEGAPTQSDLILTQGQTQTRAASEAIGQVDTLSGLVQVIRSDGTTNELQAGALVYQDDVVQTAAGGSVSLVFVDGTIFTLSESSRMILDELIYDPDGSDNAAAFNLIQGGFVFVAGQVAKIGDMEINTPTSTIGIRGTTVEIRIIVVNGVTEVLVSLLPDWPDGSLGSVELFDQNGIFVATLSDPEMSWIVSPIAGETREVPRAEAVQADTRAMTTQTNDATERAEVRLENLGSYIDLGEVTETGTAPQGGSQTTPDAPTPDAQPPAPQPEDQAPPSENTDPSDSEGEDDAALQPDGTPEDGGDAENIAATALAALDAEGGETGLEGVTNLATDGSGSDGETVLGVDPGLGDTGGFGDPNAGGAGGSAGVGGENGADGSGDGTQGGGGGPVAEEDRLTTAEDVASDLSEDSSIRLQLADLVSDPSGTELRFDTLTAPTHGAVTLLEDGTLTYVPTADFVGLDHLTYRVENTLGETDEGRLTFRVTAVNDAPVAGDDTALTAFNVPIAIELGRLLMNDTDGDPEVAQPLEVVAVHSAIGGRAELRDDTVLFSPDAGFSGAARFTYVVSDGAGGTTEGQVGISVSENRLPVAPDQRIDATEDRPVSFALLTTDRDADGHVVSLAEVAQPLHGRVEIGANGSVTYQPDRDFHGTDRFAYTLSDGQGGLARGEITLTVRPVNDAPVAAADSYSLREDGRIAVAASDGVLANDRDVDEDGLQARLVRDVAHGDLEFAPDGSFVYVPDPDFNGADSFTYAVSDGQGGTDTARVTFDVSAVVDPVVLDAVAGDDIIDIVEATEAITISGTAEPDGRVTVTFGDREQIAEIASDGRFDLTFAAAALPETGSFLVSVAAEDAFGNTTGSASRVVGLSPVAGTLMLRAAGSATTLGAPLDVFDLMFGDMPQAALFAFEDTGPSLRSPEINTATEVRFFAEDGRSFAFMGDDLAYDAGLGTITGLQVGAPTGPDFIVGSGFVFRMESLRMALANSVVDGVFSEAPLAALLEALPWSYSGSDQADWIEAKANNLSDDVFFGNGGDDVADFGPGDDRYFGGEGADRFTDIAGSNLFDGGAGTDRVSYVQAAGPVHVNLEAGFAEKSDGTLDQLKDIEVVEGSQFDDKLTAPEDGAATLLGQGGDDVLSRADFAEGLTEGGAGRDTLLLSHSGSFDFSAFEVATHYTAIEVLSFENLGADEITLTLDAVMDLSDTADPLLERFFGESAAESLTVLGDAGDRLTLSTPGFAQQGTVQDDTGRGLDVYQFVGGGGIMAIVAVDQDVAVEGATPAST